LEDTIRSFDKWKALGLTLHKAKENTTLYRKQVTNNEIKEKRANERLGVKKEATRIGEITERSHFVPQ